MKLIIKKWALSPHAAQRILDRKISIDEISTLLEDPEDIIAQGPKFVLTKTFYARKDNKVAAVVIVKKGEQLWLILTVMVNFHLKKS